MIFSFKIMLIFLCTSVKIFIGLAPGKISIFYGITVNIRRYDIRPHLWVQTTFLSLCFYSVVSNHLCY